MTSFFFFSSNYDLLLFSSNLDTVDSITSRNLAKPRGVITFIVTVYRIDMYMESLREC